MDWKEFFKPTIGKIVLFLILLIVFVPFISFDNGMRCITAPCPSVTTGSLLMWYGLKFGSIYELHYLYLVIGLIVSYLVSAIIVSLFNLVKNKIRNRK